MNFFQTAISMISGMLSNWPPMKFLPFVPKSISDHSKHIKDNLKLLKDMIKEIENESWDYFSEQVIKNDSDFFKNLINYFEYVSLYMQGFLGDGSKSMIEFLKLFQFYIDKYKELRKTDLKDTLIRMKKHLDLIQIKD